MQSRIYVALIVLLIVASSVVAACGGAQQPTAQPASTDGETLLQERCTECHGLERVERAEKTREEWDATVTDMVNRGAELNDEEKAVLIDYLAATYGP